MAKKLGALTVKLARSQQDFDGNLEITLAVDNEHKTLARGIVNQIHQLPGEGKLSVVISQYAKRRSLDQNAYMWCLLTEMAKALNSDKDRVYVEMLKQFGAKYVEMGLPPKAVDDFIKEWRAAEILYDTEINGKTVTKVRCYYGTSTFDTEEMSKFLECIINECDDLGIHTDTRLYEDKIPPY